MATITLRNTPTNALSSGATVKGTPLTILQVDDNFNNINAALLQNITINGSVVQLGGSVTVTANTSNTLTAGTGITSGGTFNGSVARTFAIDTAVVATLSGTQALTNKTINGSNNTISNIGNASLVNSSVTINGTAVSLGGSATVTANTTNALTAGSGLTSTGTFNGSAARTFTVDTSAVAMLTGNQTIAGVKTFSSTIVGNISGSAGSVANALTIGSGLSGSSYNGSTGVTIAVDSTVARTNLGSTTVQSISGITQFTGTMIDNNHFMTIAVSDETTAITTGTAKITFRAPYAMTLFTVPRASLSTASSSGNPTVDINVNGTSIFGTQKLYIPQGLKTSKDASGQATLSTTSVADDAEITIDIDTAGTGAKGLKVILYYRRTNPVL